MEQEYSILECAICHEPIGMHQVAYIWKDPDDDRCALVAHKFCIMHRFARTFEDNCGAVLFCPYELDNADDLRMKPKTEKAKSDEFVREYLGIWKEGER